MNDNFVRFLIGMITCVKFLTGMISGVKLPVLGYLV